MQLEWAFGTETVRLHTIFYTLRIKYLLCSYLVLKQELQDRIRPRSMISFIISDVIVSISYSQPWLLLVDVVFIYFQVFK